MANTCGRHLTLVTVNSVHKQGYTLPKPWEDNIGGWLSWLTLGGTSRDTLRLRRGHVRMIARRSKTQHPRELTRAHLQLIVGEQQWSAEHRKGVRTSLSSFYDWCIANRTVEDNVALCLPKVKSPQARPRPAPDHIWDWWPPLPRASD